MHASASLAASHFALSRNTTIHKGTLGAILELPPAVLLTVVLLAFRELLVLSTENTIVFTSETGRLGSSS